jgi:opacity protein-like surface antigen
MKRNGCVVFFFLCLVGALSAQNGSPVGASSGSLTTGCSVQNWRIEGETHPVISQVSFPFTLSLPLGESMHLTVTHSPAYSRWYGAFKLGGLSDTWVQGTFLLPNKNVMLNVGVGLPTGKTKLTTEEFLLTQFILTRNIYRFQVPVYGQGFCGRFGGAAAIPFGKDAMLGLGGQFLLRSTYHPVNYVYRFDAFEKNYDVAYKPGNEWSVLAGLDVKLQENLKLTVDADMTQYGADLLEGQVVFKSGQKVTVSGSLLYRFNQQFLSALVIYRSRGKHEALQGLNLEKAEKNLLGAQVEIDAVYKAYAFREGGFFLLAEGRFYSRNENEVDGASVYGGGLGLQFPLGENTSTDMRVKFFGGSLKDERSRNLLGMDIKLSLQFLL